MWNELILENWFQFTNILEQTNGIYWKPAIWSFRGQSDKDWILIPSLLRKLKENKIDDIDFAHNLEKSLIHEFIQKYPVYSGPKPDYVNYNLIRWLTIMQHYGCPTRLLDWTDSPYVAIFFACNSSKEKDGALFCLNDYIYQQVLEKRYGKFADNTENELLWENTKYIVYHIVTFFQNIRCISQRGSFSFSTNIFKSHDEGLYDLMKEIKLTGKNTIMQKLIIPKELKPEFLSRLNAYGINSETLFPGIQGFCESLSNTIDIRSNEEYQLIQKGILDTREVNYNIWQKKWQIKID